MTDIEINDKKHEMNPEKYRSAEIILKTENKEELHEMILTYINTLSYNGSWDFSFTENAENDCFVGIISFKYNGTMAAYEALSRLWFPYKYDIRSEWK